MSTKLTRKQSFDLQRHRVTVWSTLVLHHQIVRPRVLNISFKYVQCGDIAILTMILNNVIDTETAWFDEEQAWQMNGEVKIGELEKRAAKNRDP